VGRRPKFDPLLFLRPHAVCDFALRGLGSLGGHCIVGCITYTKYCGHFQISQTIFEGMCKENFDIIRVHQVQKFGLDNARSNSSFFFL
jgi:hypothetical protein